MEIKIEESETHDPNLNETNKNEEDVNTNNSQDILNQVLDNTFDDIIKSEEKEIVKCGKFTVLILSAGSIKGLRCLGCLNYLYSKCYHTHINKFVACSIGSPICYLLALGYTPLEIIISLSKNKVLNNSYDNMFNLQNLLTDKGICDYSIIQKQLEIMTIEKIGKFITINDLYTKYGKHLTVCTYNYDKKCMEYISPKNKGETPCLIALRQSCNLPIIFDKFKYDGCYYLDGAMGNYFPIDVPESISSIDNTDEVLAIDMMINNIDCETEKNIEKHTTKNIQKNTPESPLVYIYNLFFIPIRELSRIRKENKNKYTHINILELQHEDDNDSFFTYTVDIVKQLDMFSSGFKQMKAYIENVYFGNK